MLQDLTVSFAVVCHDRGSDLAEADAMAPSRSGQDEVITVAVNDKGGAVQMRPGQRATNLQFLADNQVVALTGNPQAIDTA